MNYLETLSIVAVHKIGLCIRNGTWYDKISLPVKIFEYLGLNLHVIGFPETEFSKDIKLKNILTEFAHFDIPEIKEKIKEIIEKNLLLMTYQNIYLENFNQIFLEEKSSMF